MEDDEEIIEEVEQKEEDERIDVIPIDDILDTGDVWPENESVLYEEEPYFEAYVQTEEREEEIMDDLDDGILEDEEEAQKELDILENKEDYYANLSLGVDVSEDGDLDWMDSVGTGIDDSDDLSWIEVDTPSDNDILWQEETDAALSEGDDSEHNEFEENIYELPIEEPDPVDFLPDNVLGEIDEDLKADIEDPIYELPIEEPDLVDFPPNNVLGEVDADFKAEEIMLLKNITGGGGADPDMGMGIGTIVEEEEEPITYEDEIEPPFQYMTKLREDEIRNQMEGEESNNEENNEEKTDSLLAFTNFENGRSR